MLKDGKLTVSLLLSSINLEEEKSQENLLMIMSLLRKLYMVLMLLSLGLMMLLFNLLLELPLKLSSIKSILDKQLSP